MSQQLKEPEWDHAESDDLNNDSGDYTTPVKRSTTLKSTRKMNESYDESDEERHDSQKKSLNAKNLFDSKTLQKKKDFKLPLPDISAEQLVNVTHSGWLTKRGSSIKTWKKRWFLLKGRCLYYFPSKSGTKCAGIIVIPSYHIDVDPNRKNSFRLTGKRQITHKFVAPSSEEMFTWTRILQEAIDFERKLERGDFDDAEEYETGDDDDTESIFSTAEQEEMDQIQKEEEEEYEELLRKKNSEAESRESKLKILLDFQRQEADEGNPDLSEGEYSSTPLSSIPHSPYLKVQQTKPPVVAEAELTNNSRQPEDASEDKPESNDPAPVIPDINIIREESPEKAADQPSEESTSELSRDELKEIAKQKLVELEHDIAKQVAHSMAEAMAEVMQESLSQQIETEPLEDAPPHEDFNTNSLGEPRIDDGAEKEELEEVLEEVLDNVGEEVVNAAIESVTENLPEDLVEEIKQEAAEEHLLEDIKDEVIEQVIEESRPQERVKPEVLPKPKGITVVEPQKAPTHQRSGSKSKLDICLVCLDAVSERDKVFAEGRTFHKACFRCAECFCALGKAGFGQIENQVYCKPHFKQAKSKLLGDPDLLNESQEEHATNAAAKKLNIVNPKCSICEKTVYPVDLISADDRHFHKACFRCKECNRVLNLGSYAALQGVLYCKPHFTQMLKTKGKFEESFAQQHKSAAAATASGAAAPATTNSSSSSDATTDATSSGDATTANDATANDVTTNDASSSSDATTDAPPDNNE